jgi:hypothetical protein
MNKIVLCGGFILLFIANAAAGDKFGLALKGGRNFANMLVKEKSTGRIVDSNVEKEPSFLLEAELVLGKHVSYVSGFHYIVHGYSARDIDSVFTYRYFRRARYLGLPQKLRIFFHHHRLQSFVSVGVNAEILLTARFRAEFDDRTIRDYDTDIKPLFNELTFTPEFDAGLRFPLLGGYLTFEATYARGAENVNNPDLESRATHSRRIRDLRIMLGISRYVF